MHFGHHDRPEHDRPDHDRPDHDGPDGDDTPVTVDRTLEEAIEDIEVAVDAYLSAASTVHRDDLVKALARLDELTSLGDAYGTRVLSARVIGNPVSSTVLGARSDAPLAEDVDRPEFRAQVLLVRAAKDECADGGSAHYAALQDAVSRLAEARVSEQAGGPPGRPPPSGPPDPA